MIHYALLISLYFNSLTASNSAFNDFCLFSKLLRAVDKIKGTIQMIGESETLSTALNNLEKRQKSLNAELEAVKELKYNEISKA
jgi:hypothetical protein